jgi:hypothetical protein
MTFFCVEAFDIRLRATSKFLLFQLLRMNCAVSVYQLSVYCSTEFNFTGSFLDPYLYIICIKETEKL